MTTELRWRSKDGFWRFAHLYILAREQKYTTWTTQLKGSMGDNWKFRLAISADQAQANRGAEWDIGASAFGKWSQGCSGKSGMLWGGASESLGSWECCPGNSLGRNIWDVPTWFLCNSTQIGQNVRGTNRERPKHDDDNWEPHLVDHQMLQPKPLFHFTIQKRDNTRGILI